MKYLRKFEDILHDDNEDWDNEDWDNDDQIFNDGDYVKLTELDTEDDDALGFMFPYGIVISANNDSGDGWEYQIAYYDENGDFTHTFVSGTYYIEGLMSDEEKKYFKSEEFKNKINLLQATKKYNL